MIEIPTPGYRGLEIIGDNIAVREYKCMEGLIEEMDEEREEESDPGVRDGVSALPVAEVSEPIHFTNRSRYISEVKMLHVAKGKISLSTRLRYGPSISMVKNVIG